MKILIEKIIISEDKIKNYLLKFQVINDKSGFLSLGGYSIKNWQKLLNDIKELVSNNDSIFQEKTIYGEVYEVSGTLQGISSKNKLYVKTIWLYSNDKYNFITLFRNKEKI